MCTHELNECNLFMKMQTSGPPCALYNRAVALCRLQIPGHSGGDLFAKVGCPFHSLPAPSKAHPKSV